MADNVRYILDKMAPMFRRLEESTIFTKEEIKSIVKKRTDFEYVLKRRQLAVEDFQIYISYEIMLDDLRLARTHRLGKDSSKEATSLLRSIQAGFIRHVSYVFERAIRRFPSHLPFWLQYISYLNKRKSTSILNTVFGRALSLFPKNEGFWLQAAIHELEMNNNTHAARVILQRGIRTNGKSALLWTKYFEVELWGALKIAERERVLDIDTDSASSTSFAAALVVFKHATTALPSVDDVLKLYHSAEGTLLTLSTRIEAELMARFPTNMAMWCSLIDQNTKRSLKGYTSRRVLKTGSAVFTACSLAIDSCVKLATSAQSAIYSHLTENSSRLQQFTLPILKAIHATLFDVGLVLGSLDARHFQGRLAKKRRWATNEFEGSSDFSAVSTVIVCDVETAADELVTLQSATRLFQAAVWEVEALVEKFARGQPAGGGESSLSLPGHRLDDSSSSSSEIISGTSSKMDSVIHCIEGALLVVRQRIGVIKDVVGMPFLVALSDDNASASSGGGVVAAKHGAGAHTAVEATSSSSAISKHKRKGAPVAATSNASTGGIGEGRPVVDCTGSMADRSRPSFLAYRADMSRWISEAAEIVKKMPTHRNFDALHAQQLDTFSFVVDNSLDVAMRWLARGACNNADAFVSSKDEQLSMDFQFIPIQVLSCVKEIATILASTSTALIVGDSIVRNFGGNSYCKMYEESQFSKLVDRVVECSMAVCQYSMAEYIYLQVIDYSGFHSIDKGPWCAAYLQFLSARCIVEGESVNAASETASVLQVIRDGYQRVMSASKLNPHSFSQTSLEECHRYMLTVEQNHGAQHSSTSSSNQFLLQSAQNATAEFPGNDEFWEILESAYAGCGDAAAAGLVRWNRNKKMAADR